MYTLWKAYLFMKKTLGSLIETITTAFFILVMLLAFLLVGVRLFGFQVYTVLSGSMEPQYHTGSIIYVKDVDPGNLKAGDVITYSLNSNTVATHRIVEVVKDENDSSVIKYRTKGDANDVVDANLVEQSDIIGSPVFTIPYLGYLAVYIQTKYGKYFVLSLTASVLLLSFVPGLLLEKKE